MTQPKEKRQARFMMHVCVVIGGLCIILFVISIAWKLWLLAGGTALLGISQYVNYKGWQKKA